MTLALNSNMWFHIFNDRIGVEMQNVAFKLWFSSLLVHRWAAFYQVKYHLNLYSNFSNGNIKTHNLQFKFFFLPFSKSYTLWIFNTYKNIVSKSFWTKNIHISNQLDGEKEFSFHILVFFVNINTDRKKEKWIKWNEIKWKSLFRFNLSLLCIYFV